MMFSRWKMLNEKLLPEIDVVDISTEFVAEKRQFAPEYSQYSYITMLN